MKKHEITTRDLMVMATDTAKVHNLVTDNVSAEPRCDCVLSIKGATVCWLCRMKQMEKITK